MSVEDILGINPFPAITGQLHWPGTKWRIKLSHLNLTNPAAYTAHDFLIGHGITTLCSFTHDDGHSHLVILVANGRKGFEIIVKPTTRDQNTHRQSLGDNLNQAHASLEAYLRAHDSPKEPAAASRLASWFDAYRGHDER